MKRRIFIIFFLTFIGLCLYSQNFEMKHYSDYYQNFSGASSAIFIDDFNEDISARYDEIVELISENLTEVKNSQKTIIGF